MFSLIVIREKYMSALTQVVYLLGFRLMHWLLENPLPLAWMLDALSLTTPQEMSWWDQSISNHIINEEVAV